MRSWTGLIWLKILGSYEHGDEIPGSIKRGEFLDQQRILTYQLLAVSPEQGLTLAIITGSQW
jgi:hypothetical protein